MRTREVIRELIVNFVPGLVHGVALGRCHKPWDLNHGSPGDINSGCDGTNDHQSSS